jgi:hypothetical protein
MWELIDILINAGLAGVGAITIATYSIRKDAAKKNSNRRLRPKNDFVR